jgi:hypothetical protein
MDKKIKEIFAFVHTEDNGQEGVVAFLDTTGAWVPMIGADPKRVESLRPMAERTARATGKSITLARFVTRIDVEEIS